MITFLIHKYLGGRSSGSRGLGLNGAVTLYASLHGRRTRLAVRELDTALRQGMLSVLWAADNPQAILESCNPLYLHEKVQMEGLLRDIGNFARFLQAMSFSQALVLNLANVSRDVQGSRKTV
jgi:hypothetical protein